MAFDQQLKVFSVETESPIFVSSNSHQIVAFALFGLNQGPEIIALYNRLSDLHDDAVIHIVIVDKDIELVE
jgi:hypothetical protein